jgi:hypothetical protein
MGTVSPVVLIIILSSIQFTDYPAGISNSHTVGGYIPGYDASGSNDGTFTNGNSGQDNNASANPAAVFYGNRKGESPAKILRTAFLPAWRQAVGQFYGIGSGIYLHVGRNQDVISCGYFIAVHKRTVHIHRYVAADMVLFRFGC